MNGQGFEMESRETKRIETKHRRIVTPIPVPESFDLIKEMQKYEPISNAGQPLIVWDHTEDGYKVCDPYGNKFIDFSSGVMITNAGHGNPEIHRRDQENSRQAPAVRISAPDQGAR